MGLSCLLTVSHCWKPKYPKKHDLQRKLLHNENEKGFIRKMRKHTSCEAFFLFVPPVPTFYIDLTIFFIIDINKITRNARNRFPLVPRLRLYHSCTIRSRTSSRLKVRKKIAFFPDIRSNSRYWKMRHKAYNIPHVWLALYSPVYTKHLWALFPMCVAPQLPCLSAKREKGIHSVWFEMGSGILHMHKKTVIPAVSLFFPACVLSFSYPQSSKKAYQSPFPQK